MKLLKKIQFLRRFKYMFSKPIRPKDKEEPVENISTRLPESDYDGMGNFSRFGNPPK